VRYSSSFRARPNGRLVKISVQSIIADIFTVDDTAIIILSAFRAVRSADLYPPTSMYLTRCLYPHDDVNLHRVFESQFNYSM